MNKVLQEKQMDVQIRYWNETAKQVDKQFFDFQFSRCPNAKNLFDCLIISLEHLPFERLLQLSMDDVNTNWSVLIMLHHDRCEKVIQKLLILALVLNCSCFCGMVDRRKGFTPYFQLELLLRPQIGF